MDEKKLNYAVCFASYFLPGACYITVLQYSLWNVEIILFHFQTLKNTVCSFLLLGSFPLCFTEV